MKHFVKGVNALKMEIFRTPFDRSHLTVVSDGYGSLATRRHFFLLVNPPTKEKGRKRQRKALLEAAPTLLEYIAATDIKDDLKGPE